MQNVYAHCYSLIAVWFSLCVIVLGERMARSRETGNKTIKRLKDAGVVRSAADHVADGKGRKKAGRTSKPRENDAVTTGGKIVTVRLSVEEFDALETLRERIDAGSRSDTLRSLIRSSVGMLEFSPEDASRMGEIKTELHKIGVNINQIALAANRGRIDMARQEWGAINDLRQALPKVRTWLNAVVDEQRRRGIRLYRAFVEAENV